MKVPKAKHERAGSQPVLCIICLFGVLFSAVSLGGMRLYGLYLEHRLAYITARIEAVTNKNSVLEERHSALLSPSRIYNYAKSELKMVTAQEIETVRLVGDPSVLSGASVASAREVYIETPGFFDFVATFTGVANAQD